MTANIDPQELDKFALMATRWWDPEGDLKTLHQINPLRLEYIQSKTDINGKKVIDIGCGGGILSESMANAGACVTGIDMNKPVIDTAKLHLHESGLEVEYIKTTAEDIAAERPGQYDIVTCLEMLEHVPNPASVISACSQLVKPGGHLFFSTINRNAKSYLFAIIGAEYLLKILPRNTHDFSKFIRPSELGAWLREKNLHAKDMRGISYNPFNETFKLTDDASVNYLLHAVKE